LQRADLLKAWIQERGPITVAAFMDAALYHPDFGYYARAAQKSGRAGDFFTSVDVGPLFGELIAKQIAQMAAVLADLKVRTATEGAEAAADVVQASRTSAFDFVEAGAGNGRLSADILRAMKRDAPETFGLTRLHLVEMSATARAMHLENLGEVADRLSSSSSTVPESFEGVLIANELLDAMPVHQVVMREDGLREVYVEAVGDTLVTREGPLSTSRLSEHFNGLGVTLESGWRAEVSLAAIDWVRDALRRLTRGFAIFIDYGHAAAELYSVTHSAGTLTSFSRHLSAGAEASSPSASWLQNPGGQDLTAHVDFTSVRRAAEAEGCTSLGFLDQIYFLMALGTDRFDTLDLKERLALKTLVMPGGLGTTMKVLILGKGVGTPTVLGCSSRVRVT
jgi:SAM-dependent MidA family methyltransferase